MSFRRLASLTGALLVAAIAALASYTHMRAVAVRYGQPLLLADLLPISVDGMMAATIALGDGRRHRWSAWLAFWTGVAASVLANVLAAEPSLPARCISAWPAVAFVLVVEVITRGTPDRPTAEDHLAVGERNPSATGHARGQSPPAPPRSRPKNPPRKRTGDRRPRTRRPIEQTRELVANLRANNPQVSQAELARQFGISATRLRQIDRTEAHTEPAFADQRS